MSAIVVKFDEVQKVWGIYFCHKGKVEMFPMGWTTKRPAVDYAEHAKNSAKKVIVMSSTEELEALSAKAAEFLKRHEDSK